MAIEDETDGHEATESDHEASGSCHETTIQTEGEERLNYSAKGTKEQRKTSSIWVYFKIDSSDNKMAVGLTCGEEEEVLLLNSTQATFVSI